MVNVEGGNAWCVLFTKGLNSYVTEAIMTEMTGFPGEGDHFLWDQKTNCCRWFHQAVGMTDFIQFRSVSPVMQS